MNQTSSKVDIDANPAMSVMAEGNALGEGSVRIEVRRRVLAVMVASPVPEVLPDQATISE